MGSFKFRPTFQANIYHFLFIITFLLNFYTNCFSQPIPGAIKSATEEDGSPDCYGWQLKFANGNVTDNNDGTCSIAGGGGGAPTDADYLIGTANGSLSAEIVVGTTPGGELGGTWGSPTVDIDTLPNRISSFTSSTFASSVLDETGTSQVVFNNSPTITSPTIVTSINLPASAVDALTEIDASLKSGADATLITGTEGTSGNCAEWNADGDLVEAASAAPCGSGGSGDNVTVNSAAATNVNLFDSADIVWGLDTSPTPDNITSTIKHNLPSSRYSNIFADKTGTQQIVFNDAPTITNPTLTGKIDRNNVAVDDDDCTSEQGLYWYDTTDSAFEFCNANSGAPTTLTGGSDTNADKVFWWPATTLLPLEPGENIPPIAKDAGTNIDQLLTDFDSGTDECLTVTFQVPPDVQSGSTITFTTVWYSASVTTNDVIWDFRHNGGVADGTDPDVAVTTETAGASTAPGTAGQYEIITWTETLANLGWAASEVVDGMFCRDANNASDTFAADARAKGFGILVPRS